MKQASSLLSLSTFASTMQLRNELSSVKSARIWLLGQHVSNNTTKTFALGLCVWFLVVVNVYYHSSASPIVLGHM